MSECVHCITFHHNVKLSVEKGVEKMASLETKNTQVLLAEAKYTMPQYIAKTLASPSKSKRLGNTLFTIIFDQFLHLQWELACPERNLLTCEKAMLGRPPPRGPQTIQFFGPKTRGHVPAS